MFTLCPVSSFCHQKCSDIRFISSHHKEFYVCWQWLLKFCYQIKVTDTRTFLAADRLVFLVLTLTALPEAQSSQIYMYYVTCCVPQAVKCCSSSQVSRQLQLVFCCMPYLKHCSQDDASTLRPTLMKSVIFVPVINVCRQSYKEETWKYTL